MAPLAPSPALPAAFAGRPDAADELVDEVAAATAAVAPSVLAARLRDVVTHACTASLIGVHVLYLRATRDALVGPGAVDGVRATGANVEVHDIDSPHLLLQRAPAAAWTHISALVGTPHN